MGKNKDIDHIEHEMNDIMSKAKPPAIEDAKKYLAIKPNQIFISDDAYIGDPYSLLGEVIVIRKENNQCPGKVVTSTPEYADYPIQRKLNAESKIKEPLLVRSFIVDKELSGGIEVLSYLSTNLDSKSAFSVLVYNQATGLVDVQDNAWRDSLKEWKNDNQRLWEDDNICYLLAVTGIVQKNIIRKKYYKLEGEMQAGAFGINLNGKAYTSSEEYAMDVRFGLTVRMLKYPKITVKADSTEAQSIELKEPSLDELQLFNSITEINRNS